MVDHLLFSILKIKLYQLHRPNNYFHFLNILDLNCHQVLKYFIYHILFFVYLLN